MASKRVIEVTCDVCGATKQFENGDNKWNKSVWAHVSDYYGGSKKFMDKIVLDICDKCLCEASRLYFDRTKYTLNYR